MIKPQKDFPLLKEYSKVFPITPFTIFAFAGDIYANFPLTDDLIIHETVHNNRQFKLGVDIWVEKYLTDINFRLQEEVLAYRAQVYYFKDREKRNKVRIQCAKVLSSPLYGSIIDYKQAYSLLK